MFASSSFLGLLGRAEIRDIRAALLFIKDSGMGHGQASSLVVDPSYPPDPPSQQSTQLGIQEAFFTISSERRCPRWRADRRGVVGALY